ncbi:MAG: ribonuclease R [Clostridiales bacterium]|nr:ribonuclease R [Clostridiales bacterium]
MAKKKKRKMHTGILSKHPRGFGFVTCEDIEKDVFIAAGSMGGAMNGDEVEVDLIPEYLWKQSPEGIIVKVLSRQTEEVAGTFEKSRKFGFVVPESRKYREDIFIRKKDFAGAQRGDKVVARITKYPDHENSAEGKIVEIISRAGQPGGDIKAIARSYDMRESFPSRAAAEAKAMKKRGIRPEDLRGRRDLRNETIFTIDGADSKDFDDAVSLKILDNGNYLLGVHIADVAHYVEEDGPLDKEALKRGTSVYLIDQVIPMLPKALSNNICSLNPGEDRLTLSVDMEITPDGELAGHEIYESVIHSKARLVYDDISDMLENDDEEMLRKYSSIKENLYAMGRLAALLREKRSQRGSLDFDLDEAHIRLNNKGIPVSVDIAERRTANKLIEEFMLLANETVAEHFFWLEIPFIYRIHEKPAFEKVEQLKIFLQSMGMTLRGSADSVHPRELSSILKSVEGKPSEGVVNTVTLRSMQKAFYGTSCEGHFGLALKYYCHFTSPIRRYPDLMIHRIIKSVLHDGIDVKKMSHFRGAAEKAAEQSSAAECKAIEVEREVEKLKKAEYMSYHIGEVYDGIISGTTSFGIYVQLENTVEGMIRIEDLWDDYYDYVPEKYALVGEHTGRMYKLGDSIRIVVDNVDIDRHEIDFQLAE